jgi:quercetin dioxygenase-like cupin family protein
MNVIHMRSMKNGWFVGDFDPTALKTAAAEVCHRIHQAGDKWDAHYHKKATEINYVVKGSMRIQGSVVKEGDIFILYPYEVADPEYLEDTELVIVKIPSVKDDKYSVSQ